MPLFYRRTIQAKVLSKRKAPCVGWWGPESVFEVAHFYHPTDLPDSYSHQFCYRMSYPQTLIFERDISVSGPASYSAAAGSGTLKIEACREQVDNIEVHEGEVGQLHMKSAGSGSVLSHVKLHQVDGHWGASFADRDVQSVCNFSGRYACPCC